MQLVCSVEEEWQSDFGSSEAIGHSEEFTGLVYYDGHSDRDPSSYTCGNQNCKYDEGKDDIFSTDTARFLSDLQGFFKRINSVTSLWVNYANFRGANVLVYSYALCFRCDGFLVFG